jgi:hypothetical protein
MHGLAPGEERRCEGCRALPERRTAGVEGPTTWRGHDGDRGPQDLATDPQGQGTSPGDGKAVVHVRVPESVSSYRHRANRSPAVGVDGAQQRLTL